MFIGIQNGHFCSLPVELVIKILLDVELRDLLACNCVCRFLAELIANTMQLRYKIALGVAGLEDGPPGGLTTAERLERVEKYQDAWRDVSFSTSFPILSRIAPGGTPKSHSGGVYSGLTATGDVEFCQTGSPIRGRQEMHWMLTLESTGLAAMAVCDVDCSQDLVVLSEQARITNTVVCVAVHLRSATSGYPHPLASCPMLRANEYVYQSSIHGDIVALVSENINGGPYLQLWNWKSGIMVLNIRSSNNPEMFECYNFIDDCHIMVTEPSYLAVHAFDPEAKTPCQPLPPGTGYVCALQLPPLDSSVNVGFGFSQDLNLTRAVHGMPFQHCPADSMRLLEFTNGSSWSSSCFICFFLSAVQACLQQTSSASQTWFAWEQWGPSGSRTIAFPDSSYSQWYALGTLGTKCLFLSRDSPPHPQCHLMVYEFNPWVVAGRPDAEQEAVVKDPAFVEPVYSRVRCRIDHWDEVPQDMICTCLTDDGVVLGFRDSGFRAYVV